MPPFVNPSVAAIRRPGLIPIDAAVAASLARGAASFEADHGVRLGIAHGWLHEAVRQSLEHCRRVPRPVPWLGQIAVDGQRQIVGACGFPNDPGADGFAEIAYQTFPALERRGHGLAMAAALLEIVRRAGTIRRVLAHTASPEGVSARILARAGFRNEGEVAHPGHGRVWQWGAEVRGGQPGVGG